MEISVHSFPERIEFIRTVYLFLAVQVAFCSFCVILTAMDHEEWSGTVGDWMQKNWFLWFIALIGIVVIPITVYCNRKMSRNKYMSFTMLGLFTLCLAYTLCWLSSYLLNGWAYSCQATAIMACFMCVALNLYANKADSDLKVMQGLFWCGSILLCVFIIIMLFMYE